MLIAVTMIVLITGMMYGSYAATTQSLSRYDAQSACRKRVDLVLHLMTRQIRCAFAPVPESSKDKPVDSSIPSATSEPVFRGNGENIQGEFLTFLTTAGSSTGMNATPTLVSTSYQYDAAQATLSIRQSPRAGRLTEGAGAWMRILDRITDLKVEFYDGAQWRSKWDDRQSQAMKLPRAVRISLSACDDRGGSYQAQTVIPIVCRAGSDKEQTTNRL
jgi:hypothetical protein